MTRISVGILLYQNSDQEVAHCLDALAHLENDPFIEEVLIRDQGGDAGAAVKVWEKRNPNKLPIRLFTGENVGFGAGHNALFAQKSLQSSAYLCLNPDGVLHPFAISRLIQMAEKHAWKGLFEASQEPCMPPKFFEPLTGETEWCSAACLLIPDAVYKLIGGFDERFFMYCEDVDLSWRARALQLRCYVCLDALYYHYVENRSSRNLLIWQSRLHLAHKWGNWDYLNYVAVTLEGLLQTSAESILRPLENYSVCSTKEISSVMPNFKIDGLFANQLWK